MTKHRVVFFTFFLLLSSIYPAFAQGASEKEALHQAESILIQHNGRVKAMGSFGRQAVELVTGKKNWKKKPAAGVILELVAQKPEEALDGEWIKCDFLPLKAVLGLKDPKKQHFSFNEITSRAEKIEELVRQSQVKRDADKRPSKLEQEAESLFTRIMTFRELVRGNSLRVLPPDGKGDPTWMPISQAPEGKSAEFKELATLYREKKYEEFSAKTRQWNDSVHQATGEIYRKKVFYETLYLGFQPFHWAWIFYLLGFALTAFLSRKNPWHLLGLWLIPAAFLLHTGGLVLRVLVLSRPPVSNMYESMVYMNWALMFFAFVFFAVGRQGVVLTAGSLVSALVMIYGDLLPLDTNLEVLVPVLRSNYWLTIHVLTIVSSYGAFGLAMALGHRHLILDFFGRLDEKKREESCQTIYRIIQVGVLLIGIGTVLGGVWANESWGRFWGWDPKETWALITFLGYLIVIHLRYKKLINPFWMALSSILGFQLVLMTWYGVNFVLGRGLHSYGQGSGGMNWVLYYLAAETLAVVFFLLKRK